MHYSTLSLALLAAASSMNVALGAIQSSCTQRGMYSMTWDDGPANYTAQLLDVLKKMGVRATFHVTTTYLTDLSIRNMISRIASEGHLVGLRTESTWDLMKMSDDQLRAGVVRQATVLSAFTKYMPKFIRLPYNGFDNRVLAAIESTGLIVTNYNIDTSDYNTTGESIYNNVNLSLSLKGKGQGAFISVQHDGVQQSVAITERIITLVQGSGYKIVTLDECLGLSDMTKNTEALKGGNDSVDFGPLASSGSLSMGGPTGSMPPMAGGADGLGMAGGNAPAQGGPMGMSTSAADSFAPSAVAAIIASILALLVQF